MDSPGSLKKFRDVELQSQFELLSATKEDFCL